VSVKKRDMNLEEEETRTHNEWQREGGACSGRRQAQGNEGVAALSPDKRHVLAAVMEFTMRFGGEKAINTDRVHATHKQRAGTHFNTK
jgi:hypothetical protein